MTSKLEVIEGLQEQTSDERIPYSIDFSGYGASSLDSATAAAFDEGSEENVTTTVFPTNTPSVSGAVATLSVLRALTKGHTYRIEVLAVESATYYEAYFRVYCSK